MAGAAPDAERSRVLLVGDGDLAREVAEALEARGGDVRWLEDPAGDTIRAALGEHRPGVVAVVSRADAMPLRVALSVRDCDADVPLLVTIFDPAIARQLEENVPGCRVTSLADVVAPSLAGPLVDPELAAVLPRDGGMVALRWNGDGFDEAPLAPERASRARALARSVLKPYDRSARLFFYGLIGLVAILFFEALGGMIVLDQTPADAFYGATKSLATVGPNEDVSDGPSWFKLAIVASTLLALISAACFTGGLINRLVDTSLTGLVGRRTVPRSDHVVVVGLGQVGLRLCLLLRDCGVPVVALDDQPDGENVGLARRLKLPVVIGRGANHELLRRLSLRDARSFAAVTPEDLVNLEAAMTARSVDGDLRVLLRVGDGRIADETESLLHVGHVVDVHKTGAVYIAAVALGSEAEGVAVHEGRAHLLQAPEPVSRTAAAAR